MMKRLAAYSTLFAILTSSWTAVAVAEEPVVQLIVMIGAAGSDEYARPFVESADKWQQLARAQNWQHAEISSRQRSSEKSHHDQLAEVLTSVQPSQTKQLWIVFIGHGTSERGQHKFNLVGPDVSSKELLSWIEPVSCPLIFIDCSSASSPFLPELSKSGRVIVTATKSGSENNYARFGEQLAASLLDPATDIDHDDEVSLLEAFLAASLKTEKLYKEMSRLATEHAILDDNGDKMGTGAEFFRGVRAIKTASGGKKPDGSLASKIVLSVLPGGVKLTPDQLKERDSIETRLEALRANRPNPPTEEYWNQLEQVLLELSKVYEQADQPNQAVGF